MTGKFKELSQRTAPFQESVIREMMRIGESAGAISLSQGLPVYPTPQPVLDAAAQAVLEGKNQYTFPFGESKFREAIAEKSRRCNKIQADPETQITVTCGVSEGLMATIFALTEPGDEVLILEPWYENYLPACTLAGVTPVFIRLDQPDYELDLAAMEAAVSPRTRLMIINSPHNPTGRVFTQQELAGIAGICKKFGLLAVTDEIYEFLVYDDQEHISLASLPGMFDNTVTISGLGKSYSVTGWRVGWVIAPEQLTRLIRKVHDYMTICAPAPMQAAGITALGLPDSFYQEMLNEYSKRRDLLIDGLRQVGFECAKPQGAYYVMADFGKLKWTQASLNKPGASLARVFAEYLARDIGVAVVPGDSFYWQPEKEVTTVRLNFAQDQQTLHKAVQRLQMLNRRI